MPKTFDSKNFKRNNNDGTYNSIFDEIKKVIIKKSKLKINIKEKSQAWEKFCFVFEKVYKVNIDRLEKIFNFNGVDQKKGRRTYTYKVENFVPYEEIILKRKDGADNYTTEFYFKKGFFGKWFINYYETVKLGEVPIGYSGFFGKRIFYKMCKSRIKFWKKSLSS